MLVLRVEWFAMKKKEKNCDRANFLNEKNARSLSLSNSSAKSGSCAIREQLF